MKDQKEKEEQLKGEQYDSWKRHNVGEDGLKKPEVEKENWD